MIYNILARYNIEIINAETIVLKQLKILDNTDNKWLQWDSNPQPIST